MMYVTKHMNKINYYWLSSRHYSVANKIRDYKKYYKILGISEESDQEQIRKAYLKLVKKFHPDSGTQFASAEQFQKIDEAFKILLQKKSKERWISVQEYAIEEQDIEHTAPQHRQYLSFEGVGVGTPSQRQKEFVKVRAIQAADNVLEHRMAKVSAEERALLDKSQAQYNKHKIKTKYGYDRLVEDLIQEAMSKGEFSNLSGLGKPLPQHQVTNPYVDFITHKLNQILIDNGFMPEWITLQKEIRGDTQFLRDSLEMERKHFRKYPLSTEDETEWLTILNKYEKLSDTLNKKINKYNLLVPMINQQMIPFNLTKEANRILINGCCSTEEEINQRKLQKKYEQNVEGDDNFFLGLVFSIFKK